MRKASRHPTLSSMANSGCLLLSSSGMLPHSLQCPPAFLYLPESAGLSDTITRAHRNHTEEDREVRERWSRARDRSAESGARAKLRSVEGFSPGRGPASSKLLAFTELPVRQAGLAQMSCQAGVRASMGGCVRTAARG
ncbi:Peptide chain release factor subunit 1 [Dissostichus eleginoides]|uniref:Peptide chain release factor subunit 1 n=1 Tax=Dissostichus eleginoides TaxID=100907 RepID=A0AAD9B6D3_DISEL|nr:Peptide chain release factor subunit 1 [Dissostichus eleginoides]